MVVDDLLAFVVARLGEDEAAAKACAGARWSAVGPSAVLVDAAWIGQAKWARGRLGYVGSFAHETDQAHALRHDPEHELLDMQAKWLLVEAAAGQLAEADKREAAGESGVELRSGAEYLLAVLAMPYGRHPEYLPGWMAVVTRYLPEWTAVVTRKM